MGIFSFFKKPSTVEPNTDSTNGGLSMSDPSSGMAQDVQGSSNEVTPGAITPVKTSNIVTIHYGTGMAIDSIYAFIGKDYEADGYQDALVNCAAEYCKAKENIILNSLQQLFSQVLLRYKKDLRLLDVQIENAKSLFSLNYAAILEARKDTCEEHIREINNMKEKLLAKAPEMMTMIESYRRGFSKGCVAQTTNFLSSNHSEI